MIDTGTLDLRGTRTVPFSQTINFRGMDFSGAAAIGVVLQRWDAPTATIALPAGPSAGATGVTIGAPFTAGGVVHTPVTIFISLSDMLSIPDAAEAGGDLELVWYLTIEPLGGLKARYLEGTFYVGGPQSGHGSPSPTLVTIEDTTVTVTVGGSEAIAPLATAAAQEAVKDLQLDTVIECTATKGGAAPGDANHWVITPVETAGLVDGNFYRFLVPFYELGVERGPVTITYAPAGVTVPLRYYNGDQVGAEAQFDYFVYVTVRWDAGGGANVFRFIEATDDRLKAMQRIDALEDQIAAIPGAGPDLVSQLPERIRQYQWGTINPDNSITPIAVPITGVGSSVTTETTSGRDGGAAIAPSHRLVDRVNASGLIPGTTFTDDNWSHGGHVVSQFAGQLAESAAWTAGDSPILLEGFGMNDLLPAQYNSGQAFDGASASDYVSSLEALIAAARAKGAVAALMTSPHPRTETYDYGGFFEGNPGIPQYYPRYVDGPVDPETEMYPPESESVVARDWSGSGILTLGDARFGHGNAIKRALAAQNPDCVVLLDAEHAWFRHGIEVFGEAALYDPGEIVHPNELGHAVSYGRVIDEFADDLLAGRPLKRVYRGDIDRGNVAEWPVLKATRFTPTGGQALPHNVFDTITLDTVEFARGLALEADSTVVVQTPGIYRCVGLVQLIDDQAAGISWGLGISTANEDTGDFTFTQTVASQGTARNSHDAEAELELATGEAVRLYAWCSHPGVPVRKAKLSIERIR